MALLAWEALAASRYLVLAAAAPRDAKLLLRIQIECLVGVLPRSCAYVFSLHFFSLILKWATDLIFRIHPPHPQHKQRRRMRLRRHHPTAGLLLIPIPAEAQAPKQRERKAGRQRTRRRTRPCRRLWPGMTRMQIWKGMDLASRPRRG